MTEETRELQILAEIGVVSQPGERWAPAPEAAGYLVSTEGRAVRLPQVVTQESRHGTMMTRRLAGYLVTLLAKHPRLISGSAAQRVDEYARVDLGRQVLGAFVRVGRPRELAIRKNGVLFDCRLENLVWSGDRTRRMLDAFLAGEEGCLDTLNLEHAALYLDVSRSVLCKALTDERRRLGIKASSGTKSPAAIAAVIVAARDQAVVTSRSTTYSPCSTL